MTTTTMTLPELTGTDLGEHTLTYQDTDAILYALSVGAAATDLDLVYERDLRTLPTYACALGLWAVEAAGRLGAYDPARSLHVSQRLVMHQGLPASAEVQMHGQVTAVWDKGKAALVEVEVTSTSFTAQYGIFLPGLGGFGGERGPSAASAEPIEMDHHSTFDTDHNLAALYRLTGDRHPLHIDPDVASSNGFDRPILHGLCTLGIAARTVAGQMGFHPADLTRLEARLAAPVLPGDVVEIASGQADDGVRFEVRSGDTVVISAGQAAFGK